MKQVTCKKTGRPRYLDRECLLTCDHVDECDREALRNREIWVNQV